MEIHKDSWHYAVWDFTFLGPWCEDQPPEQISLCRYVGRIIIYPLPQVLLMLLILLIVLVCFVVWNLITIGLGIGSWHPLGNRKTPFRRFGDVTFRRKQVPIWVLVCSAWGLTVLGVLSQTVSIDLDYLYYLLMFCGVMVIPYLIGDVILRCVSGLEKAGSAINQGFQKAKGVICPVVTFKEPDPPTVVNDPLSA